MGCVATDRLAFARVNVCHFSLQGYSSAEGKTACLPFLGPCSADLPGPHRQSAGRYGGGDLGDHTITGTEGLLRSSRSIYTSMGPESKKSCS